MLIIMYRKHVFIFYMHLNILRDLGGPKQQKAHVLQITPCSFQVWKPPLGSPCSPAASGRLIFWPCFHGNKNYMGEKRGKKSSCNRWHFPAQKVGFFPGQDFFPVFFFSQESKGWDMPWCGGGWAAVGCPCRLLHSEQQHGSRGFNAIIYGHFAAVEVAIWLKKGVF